jgi:GNAT superfamily N-acetyltransferase
MGRRGLAWSPRSTASPSEWAAAAVTRYADAEVALLVVDTAQRHGIGTLLLEHRAAMARHAGIRRFVAETLTANALMLEVFTNAGFPAVRSAPWSTT